MITYTKGDIFKSDADCIFNTVNCEGFMGKGIAYQFKMRFPENNKEYVRICKAKQLRPGILLPFIENGITIINFPTKDKWRNPSQMKYITDGLDAFVNLIPKLNIKKVAIPPLGCGNGGLNWDDVKREIVNRLQDCNLEIVLYEPVALTYHVSIKDQMSVYDLLLLKVRNELERPSSLRFQKTFYFANYFYGNKMFSFSRGRYGPYSKELYHEAEKIGKYQKDNGLSNTDETYKAIYQLICSKKVDDQYQKLSLHIDKAVHIVNLIEDDLLLEGAATALYLIKDEHIISKTDIFQAFKEWSDDKAARFNEKMVTCCLDKLEQLFIVQKNLFDEYDIIY